MYEDAFPDSEHLFEQAFANADPVPMLLQLLKDHPTGPAVRELVVLYTEAVEETPSRGQSLSSALVTVGHSPEAPTIDEYPPWGLINRELAEQHFKLSNWGNDEVKEYGPKNQFLLDSLLSGFSLKYGLATSSGQYAAIDKGLDAPKSSDKSEVLVVGASIQLLLHGSVIVTNSAGSYRKKAEVVAKKLKAQEAAGIVKDPHAIQVLELAILHAATGLKPENDRDDVWALLFPSKS